MNKYVVGGYILAVGNVVGAEISDTEYNNILTVIRTKPAAPVGYDHRLNANTLEWELYPVPEPDTDDEDAEESDYIEALEELGVDLNEEE
jgi:hypothetical protein